MNFHLGKPILVMLVLSVASGAAVVLHRDQRPADLSLWTFADSHARVYRSLSAGFKKETGKTLDVRLMAARALNVRLTSLFMSDQRATELPQACEVEIGSIGRYFRPPASEIGFLPLNRYLEDSGWRQIRTLDEPGRAGWSAQLASDGRIYTHDGTRWVYNPQRMRPDAWMDRIIHTRFAPWSKSGVIYGVPHDVHPVTLTYRADLFNEAGIDLTAATTWPEFQRACLKFQDYWRARGYPHRHAIELPQASADYLSVMLLQRHVNLVDDNGDIHLADRKVAQTVALYAGLVEGPGCIAAESSGGTGTWANDVEAGNLCALLTPDWRMNDLRQYAPGVSGKLRMMPLPRFDSDDAPTSTWGGTMIGIPRDCKDPDTAWKLIEYLYLSDAGLGARRAESDILPPLVEVWQGPAYRQPDPFFGGQAVMKLYTELATQIPERHVTPVTAMATAALGLVLGRATDQLRSRGMQGLEASCAGWLEEAAVDIRRRSEHAVFDQQAGFADGAVH